MKKNLVGLGYIGDEISYRVMWGLYKNHEVRILLKQPVKWNVICFLETPHTVTKLTMIQMIFQ